MKNKSPAFQFYPSDWLSSPKVTLMTPAQEGAYFRLLCYDWASDGIPDDDQTLATLSRLGEGWLANGSTKIRECFISHPIKPGFLTNERIQKEREKQRIWKEKSSEGGIKSAASRRLKGGATKRQPKGDVVVQPNVNSSSSSLSSITTPNGVAVDVNAIVELYPRREKKLECLQIVQQHIAEGEDPEAIKAGTRAIADVIRTLPSGASNRYVPGASNFFRLKRWQDDPDTWRRTTPPDPTKKPDWKTNNDHKPW